MEVNGKEMYILRLIKENPFVTQNELAEKLGLSRSAVAGYISSLTKEGKLLGRAYVLPKKKEVICIGGANIDRKVQADETIQYGTSNPASTSQSPGGVARNIAENLGRLGIDTSLFTIVGEDHEGEWLLDTTKHYADITPSLLSNLNRTGTYTALLDSDGELAVALADMSIYDSIDKDTIDKKWGYIATSELVILDTNFSGDVLEHIIVRCRQENMALCITPVSAPKVKKLPDNLQGVTWLIANSDEAEVLTGMKIKEEGDFFKAAEKIIAKGVEKVVITRGDKGLIYFTKLGEAGVILTPEAEVIDVTGAGDSLVSGIMYSHIKGLNTENACKIGIACSIITLQSNQTVNPLLNNKKLQEIFGKYFR
ncbi:MULTISPECIES: carbohydrate kinase [Bacillaceae]|jgi:pseudouridine kinase|uniref:carbohydrate kinase n=1 Tax=Bacillaceae TaxID=186817 RepID=UPI00066064EF|nr:MULTISPECIES: carbohydrate kinase [Bacillaceae]CAI9390339.1 Pseudouridine kinase [Bacillus sp. T2.9-1]